MHVYYFDNEPTDQRLPHTCDPARPVSPEKLESIGVLHWHVPIDDNDGKWEDEINKIAKDRGYKNRDVINVSRKGLGDAYEEKIKGFFREHLHEDEEIRYILDGTGYFDVREVSTEAWIRISLEKGDLLVLPAGVYHRFTLDTSDYIKAIRLFQDEPKWVPHDRSKETDAFDVRQQYLAAVSAST